MTTTRLDLFDAARGLDRGKSKFIEMCWYFVKYCFFLTPLPWPGKFKIALLRLFGAQIGKGGTIKPRVNIHFPWKLELGDYVWLGEEVFILNFEPVKIGSHVCVSQRVFLCTGNHDFRSPSFDYRNAPIEIKEGVWIGAMSFVGPGIEIGKSCVVIAGSIVTDSLPENMICRGNPCKQVKPRWNISDKS